MVDHLSAHQVPCPFASDDVTRCHVLRLSDERDLHLRRLLDAERDAYNRGYQDGRADEARDADRAWAGVPVQRSVPGPAFHDLEAARWKLRGEPRTRETFGDPHPDDYTGRRTGYKGAA